MQLDLFLTGGSTTTSTPWKGDSNGNGFVRLSTCGTFTTQSTTPLGAAGTFVGGAQPVNSSSGVCCFFTADAFADQAGTVFVERSVDGGVTWTPCNGTNGTAVAAGASVMVKVPVTAANYRARYTNGATPQTVFVLTSAFSLV